MALVEQDFKQVKDDASEEYDDQVGAIDADVEKLEDERDRGRGLALGDHGRRP